MCCNTIPRTRLVAPLRFINRWIAALAAVAVIAALAVTPASAQTPAKGGIEGRVLNGSNGNYLSKVLVAVEGTNEMTLTNDYGEYSLRNVPAGEVSLRVTYTGQEPILVKVTVLPGKLATQNVTLGGGGNVRADGTVQLDPLVVSAQRYSNAAAIAIAEERNSVNIKNVVAIDQFGDIPSGNVGEFVKFLPGVQVDYGSSNGNNQGYSESSANGVSVRGFGPEDTAILIDGLPVASTVPGNLTRQVGLDQLSVNNAARVELIKVATPDMPNNSAGGQINLITKSAFEYAKPTYLGRIFFNFSSLNPNLKKTAGPVNKDTYKTTPGIEFSASYPFSRNLGISVTGYLANEFSQSYRGQPVWNNNHASNYQNGAFVNAAGQPSSTANPVLTRYQITDSPRMTEKRSANIKLDWRPSPAQLLRTNVQFSTYETSEAQRRLDFRPTIAATGADWDATKVVGTTANSTTAMTVTTRDRVGDTVTGQMQYSLTLGGWNIAAAGSLSVSESDFKDHENGHYSEIALNLNPGRVSLYGLDQGIPTGGVITYARTTGLPLDYATLGNWVFDGTTAKSGESHNESTIGLLKVDVERDLSFLPFIGSNSLSFKMGARRDEEENKKSGIGTGFREILRPGASYAVADVLDTSYVGQSPGFGLRAQQWASTYKLFELNKTANIFYVPDFDETTNTRVENYNSFVGQQKSVKETKDAWYAMLSGRFFKNRLSLIGGVRQENKKLEGLTQYTDPKWNYVKRADGSLYTDATNPNGVQFDVGNGSVLNGVLITAPTNRPLFANTAAGLALRQAITAAGISIPTVPYGPTTGANASLASRMLQFQPNHPINQKSKGDPSFSFSAAYKLTKKIDLKAAYSRSFSQPLLESGTTGLLSGTSNFTINEYTSAEEASNQGAQGVITVSNPGLKSSNSTNYDFEASYYTDSGGKLTAGYWFKTVTNQSMNFTSYSGSPLFESVLPALGLDPSGYEDWKLTTSTNSKEDQNTSGWELEVRQDFGFLGGWGKNFQGFLSYSLNSLPEPSTPVPYILNNPDGTTTSLIPTISRIQKRSNRFGGAGLQFTSRRFYAQIRGTYKNENEIQLITTLINTNPLVRIAPAETRFDLNMGYTLSKHYSLFVSGRDVFNGRRKEIIRDDLGLLPATASQYDLKEFGVQWSVGVTGNF